MGEFLMSDILGSIICDEQMHLLGKNPLEPPYSHEETYIMGLLQTLDPKTAFCLQDSIEALVIQRHIDAFRSGIRFGIQLASELTEHTEEDL